MVSVPSVAWMRGSYALRKSSNAPYVTELPGSVCEEPGIPQVLVQLGSPDAQRAWEQFLLFYGAVLYQVARTSTRDEEEATDCFVFVCEKLAEKGYRRLRSVQYISTPRLWPRPSSRVTCSSHRIW